MEKTRFSSIDIDYIGTMPIPVLGGKGIIDDEENRRYYIDLTHLENQEWKELIGFRDHPEELQEYAELKKQAAIEANNQGGCYRKVKESMFEKIRTLANYYEKNEDGS